MLFHRLIYVAQNFADLLRYLLACNQILDELLSRNEGLIILWLYQLLEDLVLCLFERCKVLKCLLAIDPLLSLNVSL